MRKIEVKIRQIVWSFKKSFNPTTYDIVFYKDKKYYIKSSLTGNDVWNLFEDLGETPIHYYIKGNEIKIKHSLKRFINVFKSNLRFQKQNWELIDLRNPIGTRLSYNNSSDIKFYK